MEWRDQNTGQIKTWVWGVIAIGFVILLFVVTKVIGSGQTTTNAPLPAEGQSSDITELIAQLNESLAALNPTSPTTPTPTTPAAFKNYTVLAGDTWQSIAAKFGMSLEQFFAQNPTLRNVGTPTTVRSGGRVVQVANVAPITPTTPSFKNYTVLAGDTWQSIAAKFGMTLDAFFAKNPTLRNIGTPTTVRSGGRIVQVANVPAKTPTNVTFTTTRTIDTWREVAAKYNLSLAQFYALNPRLSTWRQRRPDYERRAGNTVVVGTSYT